MVFPAVSGRLGKGAVHDEIVAESDEHRHNYLSLFEAYMKQVPKWAAGLPIAVEGWKGKRYRK